MCCTYFLLVVDILQGIVSDKGESPERGIVLDIRVVAVDTSLLVYDHATPISTRLCTNEVDDLLIRHIVDNNNVPDELVEVREETASILVAHVDVRIEHDRQREELVINHSILPFIVQHMLNYQGTLLYIEN